MALEILAFTLAAILLIAVIAALLTGLAELPDPPTSTWCRNCSRWMLDRHHQSEPLCGRCRAHYVHLSHADWRVGRDFSGIRR